MNIAERSGVAPSGKDIVCVDFDATIVKWASLAHKHDVAISGAREALLAFRNKGYRIYILTSRMSPTWHVQGAQDAKVQYAYVADTLRALDIPYDWIGAEKVPATAYFDDRAITAYEGAWDKAIISFETGISPYDLGYAAGLFSGEGSITFRGTTGIELSLGMTDKDEVERFAAIMGVGSIRLDNSHGGMKYGNVIKTMYRWGVYNKKDAAYVLSTLLPFLGSRRRMKAEAALARMKGETWETNTTVAPATTSDGTEKAVAHVAVG